jgi:hypothetical protein
MPIIGFKCPQHRGQFPFDHFETCDARKHRAQGREESRPAFLPWLARAEALKIQGDVRHATLALTATRTMGCPREDYLKHCFDYYVDPEKRVSATKGTVMHDRMGAYLDPELWYSETTDPVRMTLAGRLFNRDVSMQADVLHKSLRELIDGKFPNDFQVKWRGSAAKVEHAVQLNIGRLLLAQQKWAIDEGYDADKIMLTVWDHACGVGKDGPKPLPALHMTEAEMLAAKPFGGTTTIEEILEQRDWMVAQHKEQADVTEAKEKTAASLPLVGETMMNGKKCTNYCDVADICGHLVRKYGRPEMESAVEA